MAYDRPYEIVQAVLAAAVGCFDPDAPLAPCGNQGSAPANVNVVVAEPAVACDQMSLWGWLRLDRQERGSNKIVAGTRAVINVALDVCTDDLTDEWANVNPDLIAGSYSAAYRMWSGLCAAAADDRDFGPRGNMRVNGLFAELRNNEGCARWTAEVVIEDIMQVVLP